MPQSEDIEEKNRIASVHDETKEKADGSYLAIEVLSLTDNYLIWGKSVRFNISPTHMALMSFTFGWIDGIAFQVLKTYPSMLTGNLIQIGRCIEKLSLQRFKRFSLDYWSNILARNFIVSFGCGIFGPMLCCYLKKHVRLKENSYAIIASAHFLCFLFTIVSIYISRSQLGADGTDDYAISTQFVTTTGVHEVNTFAAFLLSITSGMMIFWGSKIMWTTNLLTLNWVRLAEHFYKGFSDINQGGAKVRGDCFIIIVISIAFTMGAIFGILSSNPYNYRSEFVCSLVFIIVMYPLHLLFGYYYPLQERLKLEKQKQLELQTTLNVIR